MKSKVRKISVSPNPGEPNENGDTLRSNSICHRIVCGVYTCCILKIIFYDLSSTYKCNFLGADNKQ